MLSREERRVDSDLRRRFEPFAAAAESRVWLKRRDGRFLVASRWFANLVGLSTDDLGRVRDRELLPRIEVNRFSADDLLVHRIGRPEVFLEAPDSVSPGRWFATLKIPIADEVGRPAATFASTHDLAELTTIEEILGRAGRRETPDADWKLRLRELLDRSFMDGVRVAELANLLRLHPDHLARSFRRRFGATVAEYVRARRVAWAADRLRCDDEPIAEIAIEAGFFDQSHLTRSFRSLMGITPARFRSSARRPVSESRSARGPVVGGRASDAIAPLAELLNETATVAPSVGEPPRGRTKARAARFHPARRTRPSK